ncbi:MAG: hypothetical protein KF878_08250 [Planctomycetes bacterium]|nr:hypothetical protein [Planctomycetota bacterium]
MALGCCASGPAILVASRVAGEAAPWPSLLLPAVAVGATVAAAVALLVLARMRPWHEPDGLERPPHDPRRPAERPPPRDPPGQVG